MNCIEYGKEHREVILLLHGGGLSWWNYRRQAEALAATHHVVLPILDGHAGAEHAFSSIEETAARIIALIDERFGGSVALLGGLSLGAQVALEMLAQRKDICRHALIESACVIPSALTHAMVAPAFASCYGLISKRWFARLQFRSLRIDDALFEDYYQATCGISRESLIAFTQASALYAPKATLTESHADVHLYVGERESRTMHRSAALLHATLPHSTLCTLPGLYHGQFSLNTPDAYIAALRSILTNT